MGEPNQPGTSNSDEPTLEDRVLELARTKPDGISNDYLKECLPELSIKEIAVSINKCLKAGTLELFKSNNKLLYKYKDISKRTAIKGGDNEEKLVYKIIEEAGNKGIWIRDIRFKTNLNQTQLNKVLKSLETKKLIKAVKSVAASKKKLYMLYDLEADSSITGGAWYHNQDFESEFVDVLNQLCTRFLQQKLEEANNMGGGPLIARKRSYATASDVHKYIADLGISKVPLSVEHIESILYTVVLDNHAERIAATDGSYLYRAVCGFMPAPGLVKTTCGICPLVNNCAGIGLINPKQCNYFTEWLDL